MYYGSLRESYAKLGRVQTLPQVDQQLLDGAIEVARSGGAVTVEWFGRQGLEAESKADGSPVTQADRAAELVIRDQIEALTPECTIIGEEHGIKTGSSEFTWYVDPIDGTKSFVRGIPIYATLVAVDDEHGPAVGVIYIPATDDIVWAGRGRGCHTSNGPARVSMTTGLSGAFISTSCISRWEPGIYDRICTAGVNIHGWGDGYGFLLAATGQIDAMVDLSALSIWDVAPLRVIMTEAGGRFSARDGSDSINTKDGIASNGLVHDELLRLINGWEARS